MEESEEEEGGWEGESTEEEKEEEKEAEAMPEAEVEVEEEEDLKQEENVLKEEEEDQIYQINLKGAEGPIFTQEQERANNAIKLREIQANIISDHAIFNNVHQVSQSTLPHILKSHQVKMKQLYSFLRLDKH